MKNLYYYCASVLLLVILLLLGWWIFDPISQKNQAVLSPLPSFLSIIRNNQVSSLSLFIPTLDSIRDFITKKPEIQAKSAILYDLTTQKVLFSKNPKEKLPMASLTKIMTAIIALEHPKEDNEYLVEGQALVGEDSMGLSSGEVLSLQDLLYGLILPSGNDAAEVLASNYPQGRNAFIKAMNDKAQSLGLTDTNYTNPTGLQGDGKQYTTTYDLLVITNYALEHLPTFGKVVGTYQHTIDYTPQHKYYYLENETNLLTTYPGVRGVKTGYTPEANLCLVTYLEYQNHRIIGVLLGSENRRAEMKEILDYGLQVQGIIPPKTR